MTYATGLQAHTIIWIATEFENEHRNTLEWLSDNMKTRFRFFGVQLELRAIDNLNCIPKFTLIASPRNRSQPQEKSHKNWQEQFYSKFVNYLTDKKSRLVSMEWDQNYPDYLGFYIGEDPKIWLAVCLHAKLEWVAVNLHMKQEYAESHFDNLRKRKTDEARERYRRYLQSDAWKTKRKAVLQAAGFRCRRCSAPATEVHHETYKRIYNEQLSDLTALCGDCHEAAHLGKKQRRTGGSAQKRRYQKSKQRGSYQKRKTKGGNKHNERHKTPRQQRNPARFRLLRWKHV